MTYYKLTEYQLKQLLETELKLIALENGGVDNWKWYEESINESPDWDSNECEWKVDSYLNKYQKVNEED